MAFKLYKIVDLLLKDDGDDLLITKMLCAEDELSPSDITVQVEGVGSLNFPLTEDCIQSLVKISSKAKFGLREETLLNENVRNTNEIKGENLRVTIEQSSLSRVLDKIRDMLELEENSVLTPHLHNMLIYSRGQFFHLHQDTEKMENMIATFVIVLPSNHIGGDLIIHQGDKKHVFSTENIDETGLKCIGFYSGCMHEVQKVKYGYRVALTFNLVFDPPQSSSNEIINIELKNAVEEYFKGDRFGTPRKLVYFLNHEYTKHALNWRMLKGSDRTNADALSKVARSLKLVPYLALVEIQVSFSTCGYDSDVDELLDSNVTLSYWLDSSNKKVPYDELDVEENEICWTKDTIESFDPYKTEKEGYQGNYGNTQDFWYRRAAVVLRAESSQRTMDFLLNKRKAMQNLLDLTNVPSNKKQKVIMC